MIAGRFHWNQRVTVLDYSPGGKDPSNPMGDPLPESSTPDPTRTDIAAFMESMDRQSVIESQLDTTREHWFMRIEPGARLTQQDNRIRWHSSEGDIELAIALVNAIPGEDIELTVTTPPPKQEGR